MLAEIRADKGRRDETEGRSKTEKDGKGKGKKIMEGR